MFRVVIIRHTMHTVYLLENADIVFSPPHLCFLIITVSFTKKLTGRSMIFIILLNWDMFSVVIIS